MKCLILAGGSGDGLWPLSRKNYPKQFMNINQEHSLFQETVTRNIPFCDEFLIIGNKSCDMVIEGQMQMFQGLRYRIYLEQAGNGTSCAIASVCMDLNPSDLVYIVSADQVVNGEKYAGCVLKARNYAIDGNIALIGVKADYPDTNFGYMESIDDSVIRYVEKPDEDTAMQLINTGHALWNGGMFICRAGDILGEIAKYAPDIYITSKRANMEMLSGNQNIITYDISLRLSSANIEKAVFEKTNKLKSVTFSGEWKDIRDFVSFNEYDKSQESIGIIEKNVKNSTIINKSKKQLLVANNISDILVVNTQDAVYVSDTQSAGDIRNIICDSYPKYKDYFDNGNVQYRTWGKRELLDVSKGYMVRKITVYPQGEMSLHRHEKRSEQWSIVQGTATIMLRNDMLKLEEGQSVSIPAGTSHKLKNDTDKILVIIEVGLGEDIAESDIIKIYEREQKKKITIVPQNITKLEPSYKDYLWGGNRLRKVYNKQSSADRIAETWELSAHQDGQSIVVNGDYAGLEFGKYLDIMGKDILGWKCQYFERFPILIKFIDAQNQLSIQIHPDDDYAFEVEGEFGKNEMWYIIDCEPDSTLYCGLKKDVTKKELRQRLKDNTIIEILNEIKVKPGDVIFVSAGTIHAINSGILICEIQQNSNSTYRLYDYNRKDKDGKLRPLHIDKAMDVVNTKAFSGNLNGVEAAVEYENSIQQTLSRCKYFECVKYDIESEEIIHVDDSSFKSITVIRGNGEISCKDESMKFAPGDSYFIPAGRKIVKITGKCQLIITNV